MTTPEALVTVRNLRVGFGHGRHHREVLHGVDLSVPAGGAVALVGESGSGKSVAARTLLGLTGPGARVDADELSFAGESLRGLSERRWRTIRGVRIGLVLQDALVSLDPLRTVGVEIAESLRAHGVGDAAERRARVQEMLTAVGVPEPQLRAAQRSGELSGGLRQRALIAAALALDPPLIIADEPTTALDAAVQVQVLDLLAGVRDRGAAVLLISHDLGVVSRVAEQVVVMHRGRVVESGPTDRVLGDPREEYTKALLAAVPSRATRGRRLVASSASAPAPAPASASASASVAAPSAAAAVAETTVPADLGDDGAVVLEARELVKAYRGPDGVRRTVVDHVDFRVHRGETLGIVGQSGSGKTTVGRMLLGVLDPDGGDVTLHGRPWSALSDRERRPARRTVGTVTQDPLGSFDPRLQVGGIIAAALDSGGRRQRRERVVALLQQVGLGEEHFDRSPLQLSGGQRQRVAIARALAAEPEILILDEPVSALDVSVQAQVLDLLVDLQRALGTTYVFISHDFGVIEHLCDRVLVMRDGQVVEAGQVDDVFRQPSHEYTRELLAAVPRLQTTEQETP